MVLEYLSLFVSAFLSATILPLGSEGVLALLIYQGLPIWTCLLIATLGNSLGGLTNYMLGHIGNLQLLKKYFNLETTKIKAWKSYADQYGAYLAFFAWVPFIGDPILIALGFFRVNAWSVIILMTLGKFLRYALVVFTASSL